MEVDDEDVDDSRTVESVWGCRVVFSSGVRCRVVGGLFSKGLACLTRRDDLERVTPGEYDDIEVGVDEMLNAPGDSE